MNYCFELINKSKMIITSKDKLSLTKDLILIVLIYQCYHTSTLEHSHNHDHNHNHDHSHIFFYTNKGGKKTSMKEQNP